MTKEQGAILDRINKLSNAGELWRLVFKKSYFDNNDENLKNEIKKEIYRLHNELFAIEQMLEEVWKILSKK